MSLMLQFRKYEGVKVVPTLSEISANFAINPSPCAANTEIWLKITTETSCYQMSANIDLRDI